MEIDSPLPLPPPPKKKTNTHLQKNKTKQVRRRPRVAPISFCLEIWVRDYPRPYLGWMTSSSSSEELEMTLF